MEEKILNEIDIFNNSFNKRLEFSYKRKMAYIDYILSDNNIILTNTYIPQDLHLIDGFGQTFVLKVKHYIDGMGLIIIAKCPYAKAVLKCY